MDIMHPLRHKMAEILLAVLPFDPSEPFVAMDLGVGTGYLTDRFLKRFPRAKVIAIDGARPML